MVTALRWLALGLLLLAPGLACAQAPVRVASFPGYGRVVFEFARPTGFEVAETDGRAQVVFTGAPALGVAKGVPRNVRAIERAAGSVTLMLAPGAHVRSARQGNLVVIDVLNPVPGQPARGPAQTAQASVPAAPTAAAVPAKAEEAPPPAPAAPAPEPPPVLPAAARPASILVPLDPSVGAAAFRRSAVGMVVFDQRVPLDLAALGGGPAFAAASVQLGPASTVLTLPLPASRSLALSKEPHGWRVTQADDAAPSASIAAEPGPGGLLLKLDSPSQVVSVADPSTGLALLVGTANPAAGAGPAMTPARRAPGYALAPTWLGVLVEPLSDLIELRPAAKGFMLASPGMPAVAAPAQAPEDFTRRFELPDLPVAALTQRLTAQQAAAAAAPPRARSAPRMAVAQSLLSLGLATEAQAVLGLIATEDPIAAADPTLAGLTAVAALLAGRSPEAAGLDDPRLDGADDVALWRGVRDAMRETDAEAGRGLARLLPLANAYPAALRDRLRPLIVEAAVSTGQGASVAGALAQADDRTLDFARALQRERDGDTAGALQAFDALAAGRDQLTQVRAGVRAAELRLKEGALTPAQAADALERQAAIWRGDARESRMRLRAAELRAAAGAFRPALEVLRDTERLFPEQQPAIRAAMAGVVRAMLSQPQAVEPLELVTLVSDYAGLLPEGAGDGLPALLADKLVALDLPGRAVPVLASLMAAASAGPARAGIGARLAEMQLENAAAPAAEAALKASDAPGLPAPLVEQRTLALARARAAQGDLSGATAALQALGTPATDDLRATLLSQASDWPGSLAALSDLAAKTVPADGPLSDGMQDTVLRQATSAAQAHDAALLADLSRRYGPRLAGPRADLFRVLTAAPLQSPADLPRAAAELALARVLPDRLHGLSAQNTK
jgi:hypothetical protein